MFDIVQSGLVKLNLALNSDKSCCMRVGPRCDAPCINIVTLDGNELRWTKEMRYLGIYITAGRDFACSIDMAKKSFNRACNAILGKLLGIASEDLIVHLIKIKCMPILLYGSEACSLNKRKLGSLDFSLIRFAMKVFKTGNAVLVRDTLQMFGFELPSEVIPSRSLRFMERFAAVDNLMRQTAQLLFS